MLLSGGDPEAYAESILKTCQFFLEAPRMCMAGVTGSDLKQRIGFTAEEQSRLVDLDYGYIAKNDFAMKEWWDKVFKA